MKERWKPIPNHETYEISNLGNVRNKRGRLLNLYFTAGGLFLTICEQNARTTLRVSRLVGQAFSRGWRDGLVATYRDGDRRNCSVGNLKFVPRSRVTGKPYSVNPRDVGSDAPEEAEPKLK
jgi:NUMOD4 motif